MQRKAAQCGCRLALDDVKLIYAIVGLFAVWAYLRSLQKRRHTNRMKEQRKYLQDQLLSAKKQE